MQAQHWPMHSEEELNAVNQVLASGKTNYWTGTTCKQFEKEFAEFVGTEYAIALMNGTVALEAGLYALDIGPGDEVITSCRTFIASASCIIMRGATPILADVDPDSQNITAATITPHITAKTKAIIVVHLAGWPAEMDAIMALAKKHGLKVIEDCAQAHGAQYRGRNVGSFGDIGAFSFCQDKIMTTGGEGGMVTTNDAKLWQKMWSFKDHGKNFEKVYQENHPPGYRWLHDQFGTNWRMTEMQAAIGLVQLKKLPEWLTLRRRYAEILNSHFSNIPALRVTLPPSDIYHAYYKYYVFIRPERLNAGFDRDKILIEINARGIPCFSGICSDISLENAFANNRECKQSRHVAKLLGETSLMLLVHPTLTLETIEKTARIVSDVITEASC